MTHRAPSEAAAEALQALPEGAPLAAQEGGVAPVHKHLRAHSRGISARGGIACSMSAFDSSPNDQKYNHESQDCLAITQLTGDGPSVAPTTTAHLITLPHYSSYVSASRETALKVDV